jgi:hypothetical protein
MIGRQGFQFGLAGVQQRPEFHYLRLGAPISAGARHRSGD